MSEPEGAHPGILAELGFGPSMSWPDESWTWFAAQYNTQTGNNDEYRAQMLPMEQGSWSYAWRFSIDGGHSWASCDLSDNPGVDYDPNAAGRLIVGAGIWWGNLQWPYETTAALGEPSELIFGQVYQEGVTDLPGQGAGLQAELGYGPPGSEPRLEPDLWSWTEGRFNADRENNDEYMAELLVQALGRYDYAWRYSLDGTSWVYADSDGSRNGYDPNMAGQIQILEEIPTEP